jgi:LemA protein
MGSPNITTIIVIFALVVLLTPIVIYNRLVRLRQMVKETWSDVDTELRRRHDLIPNLVETVRGYAAHERQTMAAVTEARQLAAQLSDSPAQRAQQEGELTRTLRSLLAVAESYPNLKANQGFLKLQTQLADTEDRIQAARRFYNANVRENNTAVQSFPSNLIARVHGFRDAEFFELADPGAREPVAVSIPGEEASGRV